MRADPALLVDISHRSGVVRLDENGFAQDQGLQTQERQANSPQLEEIDVKSTLRRRPNPLKKGVLNAVKVPPPTPKAGIRRDREVR
jgi:hypothetical protein